MRKAFTCAWIPLSLYIRSGRVVFPLLALVAYLFMFYSVLPVEVVSSIMMSTVVAFVWGAWIALAMNWSEDALLRQILLVKCRSTRYYMAQAAWLLLFGAAGGTLLVCAPMLAHAVYLPQMFVRQPSFSDVALGILINACAAICGVSVGVLFHPNIVRDRKMAYLLCMLTGLFSLVDGMSDVPFAFRAMLPPLYDSIYSIGQLGEMQMQRTLLYCFWYLLYAGVISGLRLFFMMKVKEH